MADWLLPNFEIAGFWPYVGTVALVGAATVEAGLGQRAGISPDERGLDAARSADHSVAAVESVKCPARNTAVKPNFLDRDLPDISVKVMHLNEGAADRERHLSTVADY